MSYTINQLWDSRTVPEHDNVFVQFEYVDNSTTNTRDLQIKVQAPFYDDPNINDTVPKGSMDKLWEYEVVEVFLLGSDEKYLEIEFSPKEQYLLLQLQGYRNVIKSPLYIDNYSAKIDGKTWSGTYVIPFEYLPPNVAKFNAYAIHGTDDARQYLALFPTPFGKFKEPDFHRLDYFQKFEL
ncbi:UPF0462 protein C4orf33 homolog isoform X2 [Bradysia coprophila]|nr:UPF0462 protein C4orf33 homolog isoform X2 [Bradysia coprophila]